MGEEQAGEFLSSISLSSSDEEDQETTTTTTTTTRGRRSICYSGCGRPTSVCLCPYLPPKPIPTSTTIILLHHPYSLSHNSSSSSNTLSTLPPLSSSLLNLHLIPGRRLRPGLHPLLDHPPPSHQPPLFLFPSLPSSSALHLHSLQTIHLHFPTSSGFVLIAFDGTWTQAREMVKASMPFLERIGARHVTVGDCVEGEEGPSSYESELVVRKEPAKGCVSTMEAVARAVRVLETDERVGVEVEERLLAVLRAMVGFQARHLKPAKPRIKMRKKKEMRKLHKESSPAWNLFDEIPM